MQLSAAALGSAAPLRVQGCLRDAGFSVHLAHPAGNDWGTGGSRTTNATHATSPICCVWAGWRSPGSRRRRCGGRTGEARELVRYRAKLVQLRSGLKAQVHAVMAKEGVLPQLVDMFGPGGQRLLDEMELADAYTVRVESLSDLIEVYDR
jgi:hypothetical protein